MKKQQPPPISKEVSAAVVKYWKTSKLNQIPTIAKEFNLSTHQVSKCINKYLATCLPRRT